MPLFRRKKLQVGLSTERIEFFSDAVFAIAMTLLVLEFKIPELSSQDLENGFPFAGLWELWPKFLSYVISFSIIAIFWVGHHIMFHYIKRSDRVLLWLNSFFLMIIAFIPFPAALLGTYTIDRVPTLLYGITLFAASLVFNLIWLHASYQKHLVDKNLDQKIISLASRLILVAPIVYLIAVLLAFYNPLFSIAVYIFIPIFYIIPSAVDQLVDFEHGKFIH